MRTPGKQKLRSAVYGLYERRLARSLSPDRMPRHIGVIIDGNRRWARATGDPVSRGHEAGANKITEFLGWCDEVGVKVVTVWMLSTDNLSRPAEELEPLLRIIEQTVEELTSIGRWRIHPVGALDLLPGATAEVLKGAEAATQNVEGMLVNVAVGYGGRRELADAVRSLLLEEAAKGISIEELAERVDVEHIAEHLYTKGQPDPDLVIRTSGEQRLGGFLLWQSALSEFYFCEALWPDFRHVDFLRAIRNYAQRERRFGT
ncbi:short-chain Z-isoprenyl diphosphate synthase [Kribbella voronezhensis]|uniref:Isoprenyl transferase n=1 Tax=Kribbella voronezhensis TaxID=2512212 RepID=A0A4R7TGN6_9ACTN|nr:MULTISPECIES: isoprenyl transferase [Kribbella]TDU91441.1 short-chain Z-isoprenyl diphosphate synthase [Kribbella voronezhensis]